jgi:hypothetical protein
MIFMGILVFFIISLGCVSADPDLGSDSGYQNSSNELVSANLTQSNNTHQTKVVFMNLTRIIHPFLMMFLMLRVLPKSPMNR